MPHCTPTPQPSASSVKCLGEEFRPRGVVCTQKPSDNDYPVFGEVQYIILVEDLKQLIIKMFTTEEFNHHYHAYKVLPTNNYQSVLIGNLALHQVFHKYCVHSHIFVVVRSCHHIEHNI